MPMPYKSCRWKNNADQSLEGHMLITAERDGYFGLRAKPTLGVFVASKSSRSSFRFTQVTRVVLLSAIFLCIHWQHDRFMRRQLQVTNWSDVMPVIREVLPGAESVEAINSTALATVLDADRHELGSVVRTSPMANHILGFSGPTDVLLVFDKQGILIATRVISSQDTRDHVQQLVQDPEFLNSLNGRKRGELLEFNNVDAVSGATLSSFAVLESIRFRLANADPAVPHTTPRGSLKFPHPPRLEDVKRLYPEAASVKQSAESHVEWQVLDVGRHALGQLWRASPVADNNVGYQGPTDLLIAVDEAGLVTGITPGESFDNEPYVGYVRDDAYFRKLFNGQTPAALAALDAGTVEGVSGATMTSQSAARSLQMTAQAFIDGQRSRDMEVQAPAEANQVSQAFEPFTLLTLRNLSTIAITLLGVILGLTHLRGRRWLRILFQCVLIGWLGLINGDMVSQALLLGWVQSGIPWQHAFGLTFLTTAAFLVPITTGRNVYCSHLCPHGAVQQLVRRRVPWQMKLSATTRRWLNRIPMLIIAWVVAIGMLQLSFSAVDIEPFDAWLWNIAGMATISVAIIGLIASCFIPMAYCRFGCPTGALLNYLSHSSGKSLNRKDLMVAVLVGVSAVVLCWPG